MNGDAAGPAPHDRTAADEAWQSVPSIRGGVDDAPAGQTLGDFQLIREIGRGGMGVVYEARQLSLGRAVAVKVLPFAAAFDARHLQRFRNEAQMAAQLHHTNIVPVYAVGCERSVHFYAMQLIEGQSLAETIDQLRRAAGKVASTEAPTVTAHRAESISASHAADRPIRGALASAQADIAGRVPAGPFADSSSTGAFTQSLSTMRQGRRASYFQAVARLGVQAAEALEHAHQAGVVHRDIKPANLLLDARGTLWVTDFGLAQLYATENSLTQPGDVLGTFRYMSPEQASGKGAVLDQRTDVYSLGLTLYELLTLERAVRGTTREELLHHIESIDPPPARRVDRAIPAELETIVGKAIAKSPADRYPSARALADDLGRYLRDEPIRARPPTIRDKAFKWVRRHRTFSLAAVAVLVLTTIALLVTTILVGRAQRRAQVAYANEHAERVRADRSSAMAHEAVNYFSAVAADEFPRGPQFMAIKRDMLETAMRYYEAFLTDRSDDPTEKPALDAARARVASILEELNDVDESNRLQFAFALVAQSAVREELGLTDAQVARIDSAKAAAPSPPDFRGPNPTTQPTAATRAEFRASLTMRRAALAEALTPTQYARLRQISRQIRGIAALDDPDVMAALAPDARQSKQIDRLARSSNRPMRRGMPGDLPDEATVAWQRERLAEAMAILTPAQRAAWDALAGPPFGGRLVLPDRGNDGRRGPRPPEFPGEPGPPREGSNRP